VLVVTLELVSELDLTQAQSLLKLNSQLLLAPLNLKTTLKPLPPPHSIHINKPL
jgi:hypothetical protein